MTGSKSSYDFIDPRQAAKDPSKYAESITPKLIDCFCEKYASEVGNIEISEIRLKDYSYLFDHAHNRLVADYGNVSGKAHSIRDKYRQQAHPGKKRSGDDKGHAIAHSAGGGMDINFFSQRSGLNRGAFRHLERLVSPIQGHSIL